jgi:hypothetical protein
MREKSEIKKNTNVTEWIRWEIRWEIGCKWAMRWWILFLFNSNNIRTGYEHLMRMWSKSVGVTFIPWRPGENAKRSWAFRGQTLQYYSHRARCEVKLSIWSDSYNTMTGWECEVKQSIWSNLCYVMTGRENAEWNKTFRDRTFQYYWHRTRMRSRVEHLEQLM